MLHVQLNARFHSWNTTGVNFLVDFASTLIDFSVNLMFYYITVTSKLINVLCVHSNPKTPSKYHKKEFGKKPMSSYRDPLETLGYGA